MSGATGVGRHFKQKIQKIIQVFLTRLSIRNSFKDNPPPETPFCEVETQFKFKDPKISQETYHSSFHVNVHYFN